MTHPLLLLIPLQTRASVGGARRDRSGTYRLNWFVNDVDLCLIFRHDYCCCEVEFVVQLEAMGTIRILKVCCSPGHLLGELGRC